jgi:hypothetical protein
LTVRLRNPPEIGRPPRELLYEEDGYYVCRHAAGGRGSPCAASRAEFVNLMKKYPKATKRFALWDLGDNFDRNAVPKAGEAPWYECEELDGATLCAHPDRPQ